MTLMLISSSGTLDDLGTEGEDLGAVFGDGDGVLEVGAVAAVDGDGGPAVGEDFDLGGARVDHGFDGEDHAGFEAGAFAAGAEVGDLGVFVHLLADAVADELLDDAVACGFADLLDGEGDVAEAATDLGGGDGAVKGLLGDFEEFGDGGGGGADGVGDGGVGVEAVDDEAGVDGEDVALSLRMRLALGMPWTTSSLMEVQRA